MNPRVEALIEQWESEAIELKTDAMVDRDEGRYEDASNCSLIANTLFHCALELRKVLDARADVAS